jgi:CDP-glycerol glycerophosphotransferase (TagB/SpsB family)
MGIIPSRVLTALRIVIGYVARGGLFLVSFVFPRTDTIWVFGAKGGEAFVDNSKYLYLHTVAEREHIRAVWLSRDDDVVLELRKRGYEAYHTGSLRGMWSNLRAGYAFVSHGMPDVNRWCSAGTTTVMLWHGIALKQIGWDGYKRQRIGEKIKGIVKETVFDRYDWFVVPSEAMVEPFSSAFHADPDRILPLGYPRNDVLTGAIEDEASDDLYREYRELHENRTTILYTPTKHPETGHQVTDHLRLAELDVWLADRDAHLLLKPHPAEPIDLGGGEFSRIIEVPEGIDVYPLLRHTDMLITDYSSIYFDYLLLDKPVVFYPFDLEEYRSTRGFYLDYEEVTPGPMATDFDELLRSIETSLETDEFAAERRSVRERYLQTSAGGRCEAICDRFDPRTHIEPCKGSLSSAGENLQ